MTIFVGDFGTTGEKDEGFPGRKCISDYPEFASKVQHICQWGEEFSDSKKKFEKFTDLGVSISETRNIVRRLRSVIFECNF